MNFLSDAAFNAVCVKEINAAAMAALLEIGAVNTVAAGEIFGCSPAVVSRLLELSERDQPPQKRRGLLDALADVQVPLFELGATSRDLDNLSRGHTLGHGTHFGCQFADTLAALNEVVVHSLSRLCADVRNAILAMGMRRPAADLIRSLSPRQLADLGKINDRSLVRTRLTETLLDQLFTARARPVVENNTLVLVLATHIERDELGELIRVEAPPGEPLDQVIVRRRGRPEEAVYQFEQAELARLIGALGGRRGTLETLLGTAGQNKLLRRLRSEACSETNGARGKPWMQNAYTRLGATASILMASRLVAGGFGFAEAICYAYFYYRYVLATGHPDVLAFEDFVSEVAVAWRARRAYLTYFPVFEAAHVTIERDGEILNARLPQHALAWRGRLGMPRNRRAAAEGVFEVPAYVGVTNDRVKTSI